MNNFYYVSIVFIQATLQLKVVFVIVSLLQFTLIFHTLNAVCRSKPSLNKNLRNFLTKEFFTIEVLYITCRINKFLEDMHFKVFTVSKMKKKYNHLYLEMILFLSGNIKLNPGPVNPICHEVFLPPQSWGGSSPSFLFSWLPNGRCLLILLTSHLLFINKVS